VADNDLTETQAWGELSNTCVCEVPEEIDPDLWQGCDGECWDDALYFWNLVLTEELDAPFGTRHLWRVNGLPLWNGGASGIAEVRTTRDLLDALTVRGAWRLRWAVLNRTTLQLNLSHHDAPMGGLFLAEYLPETDDDDNL